MRHGSLFSGIGGFDLAAQWMGWENIFHCEKNTFSRKILNHYWPLAISYEDITTTDFTVHRGSIDIITGGFPCQPFSMAGQRKGTEDDRYLWPEMLRAIREIQPRYVVGENVHGIVNWSGGMVFDQVQADLEAEGYEVQAVILPACGVDAPHRRDRVWFVAYTGSHGHQSSELAQDRRTKGEGTENIGQWEWVRSNIRGVNAAWDAANSNRTRLQKERAEQQATGVEQYRELHGFYWENFPTQSPVCSGDDGLPAKLDGIAFPKWRAESIKAAGNAIVPQVALEIFRALEGLKQSRP